MLALAPRMGLYVGKRAVEELAGALDGKVFHPVDALASAVVAPAWIPFRVFVREHAAHCLHDGRTREILGCNELDGFALAVELCPQQGVELGIGHT